MLNNKLHNIIHSLHIDACDSDIKQLACVDSLKSVCDQFVLDSGYRYFRIGYRKKGVAFDAIIANGIYLSNFPEQWDQLYIEKQYYLSDPLLRFTQSRMSAEYCSHGFWDALLEKALLNPIATDSQTAEEYQQSCTRLFDDAAGFGLHSGAFMQVDYGSHVMDISMATPVNQPFEINWQQIKAGLILMGDALLSIHSCSRCNGINTNMAALEVPDLSPAERKILRLFYLHPEAGHKEIAELRACTVDNVDFHLKRIRKKFNVKKLSGHQLANLAENSRFLDGD